MTELISYKLNGYSSSLIKDAIFNLYSIALQSICPIIICISCILDVFSAGIDITSSENLETKVEFFPVNEIHLRPIFLLLSPIIIFLLLPEVDIAMATSPDDPKASIWREKRNSNPKSFPIAVSADVSVDKEIAGKAFYS